ncbi:MAG: GNAT family N-acetyltransferase [Rhodomicrobiaceae bacterium]
MEGALPELEITESLSDAEIGEIEEILDAAGREKGFHWNQQRLEIVLRQDGRIVAGLRGKTALRWLFVSTLAVAPECRGSGYGRKLMEEAERVAIERGCQGIWLDTFSFQAPGFYAKLGFERFGVIEDFPPGESRSFLMKRLV